jgi:hypothetical protein
MPFSFFKKNITTNELEKLITIKKNKDNELNKIHAQSQKKFEENYDKLITEVNHYLDSVFPTYDAIKKAAETSNQYIIFRCYEGFSGMFAIFGNDKNKYNANTSHLIGSNNYDTVNTNIKKGIRLNSKGKYEISVKYIINYLGNKEIKGLGKPKKILYIMKEGYKLCYKW